MKLRTLALWACLLAASASFGGTHKIKSGENLETIANKMGTTARELRQLNPGLNERRLQIGQTINVPGGQKQKKTETKNSGKSAAKGGGNYTVQPGDNNWDIARAHGISPRELNALNGGRDLSRLKPGDRIRVPGPSKAQIAAKEKALREQKLAARREQDRAAQARRVREQQALAQRQAAQRRTATAAKAAPVAATVAAISTGYAKTSKDNVIVRRGPSTSNSKATTADKGLVGKVVDRQGDWYQLRFENAVTGWVRRDMLTELPATAERVAMFNQPIVAKATPKPQTRRTSTTGGGKDVDDVIGRAKSLMGTRYVWGGTSRGGFDCSGFVGYVMRGAGINLPRTSIEQSRVGQFVPRDELKKGDLVFFNTRGGRVSHVGIFVGNNNFIHASSGRGRVRVDSLTGYFSQRYVVGRRVGNFETVGKAVDDVKKALEDAGELPKTADAPEVKVQPGTDEVVK